MTVRRRTLYLIHVEFRDAPQSCFRLAVLSPSEEAVLTQMLRNMQTGSSPRLKTFHIERNPKLVDNARTLIRDIKNELQQPGTATSPKVDSKERTPKTAKQAFGKVVATNAKRQ